MTELSTNGAPTSVEEIVESILPEDPEELRRIFIEEGGRPNLKSFQTGQQAALDRARIRVQEARNENPFANASQTIGKSIAQISVYFVQIVFIIGLPLALALVLIAEGAAITDGVSIFSPNVPGIYSLALMVFMFVILFVYEVVHRSSTPDPEEIFSVRQLFGRIRYTIGLGAVRYKTTPTPIRIVESATLAVSRSIIFFGILGRLKTSLDETQGLPWGQALLSIVTNSSLETMLGYIGNILLAMTLLSSAHVAIYLIHRFYVLSTGGLDIASDSALGFLSVVDSDQIVKEELKQFYRDQIYLLRASNDQNLKKS